MTVIPVSDRFVRQIRVAEPQHGVTRVVLDLAGAADATLSRLDNPSRLIIELRGRNGSEAVKRIEPTPAPPLQLAARKIIEHRTFVPPPAPPITPIYSRRASDVRPEPPRLFEAQNVMRWSPVAAINSRLAASAIIVASAPPILAKPTASEPLPVVSNAAVTIVAAKAPVIATPAVSVAAPVSPALSETALPAKRNSSGDRSMIRVLGLKVGRIVLDPGHGGHDTGTVGPDGLREKDSGSGCGQAPGRID